MNGAAVTSSQLNSDFDRLSVSVLRIKREHTEMLEYLRSVGRICESACSEDAELDETEALGQIWYLVTQIILRLESVQP